LIPRAQPAVLFRPGPRQILGIREYSCGFFPAEAKNSSSAAHTPFQSSVLSFQFFIVTVFKISVNMAEFPNTN
jgi:hypothetical protein